MIKGVIFDLDGTIIDTMPIWDNLAYNFLKENNIDVDRSINEVFYTMSSNESCDYIKETYLPNLSSDEIKKELQKMIFKEYVNAPLKEGVLDFIKFLSNKGIKMCIATAGDSTLATQCLKNQNIYDYFDFLITCDDVGFSKEHSKIFDVATDRLKLKKKDVIIFEDSDHCIETVTNAGYKAVMIYDSYAKNRCKFDCKIKSFNEILNNNTLIKNLGF